MFTICMHKLNIKTVCYFRLGIARWCAQELSLGSPARNTSLTLELSTERLRRGLLHNAHSAQHHNTISLIITIDENINFLTLTFCNEYPTFVLILWCNTKRKHRWVTKGKATLCVFYKCD